MIMCRTTCAIDRPFGVLVFFAVLDIHDFLVHKKNTQNNEKGFRIFPISKFWPLDGQGSSRREEGACWVLEEGQGPFRSAHSLYGDVCLHWKLQQNRKLRETKDQRATQTVSVHKICLDAHEFQPSLSVNYLHAEESCSVLFH